MRLSISEILEEVNNTRGKYKRVGKMLEYSCPQLKNILDMAFNPKIEFLLPKEEIKYDLTLDNVASSRTRLYTESKKLINYTNLGPYPNLDTKKRVELFKTLLETLHTEDAKLVAHIVRYRGVPYSKIDIDLVKAAFPILTKDW